MNVLVLSGGQHPYAESTPVLRKFLEEDGGHRVVITEDASVLLSPGMREQDVLVFNTRRENELVLTPDERVALTQYVGGGKGFVCLHIATCRPREWPEYHHVTGGGWISGTSYHPPYGQFKVDVKNASHPGAANVSSFVTDDELYMGIDFKEGNDVFLTAEAEDGTHAWGGQTRHMEGGTFPLAWTRTYGNGKVFVNLLGHNGLSFQTPEFQQLVLNGVEWAGSRQ